jgi:hypothetical protein
MLIDSWACQPGNSSHREAFLAVASLAYGEIGSAVKSESKPMGGTGWCSWREYWFAATAPLRQT